AAKILVSMIPIGIVGLFFREEVEKTFTGLVVVGICLLITAALLSLSYFAKARRNRDITLFDALIIGVAQAIAVLPGLSRSGSTIGTGLILGNKKEALAHFSFLMAIPPILGMALLDAKDMVEMGVEKAMAGISVSALVIGFLTAFVTGCLACKLMINLVKKGKMIYFAAYCALVGVALLVYEFI
ncbi:MAG: undecaprenyl-diphosphate phosphatase, partial [Bacteroidaceae bacterium]|nr:undecaprenyl-diphosphate phosphatase [Bacteroidaceae bacterium]